MSKLRVPILAVIVVAFTLGTLGATTVESQGTWKVVVLSGAYSDGSALIQNWDNARRSFLNLLFSRGIEPSNVRVLSSHPEAIGNYQQGIPIARATEDNLKLALKSLDIMPRDNVFLYITSHGTEDSGIYLEVYDGPDSYLTVGELENMVDVHVGAAPSVVFLSACYSGQFLPQLEASNRVVFTAAREDRSSFGCGEGSYMPDWDATVIETLEAARPETTWEQVYAEVQRRIRSRESGFSESSRSYPQASIPVYTGLGEPLVPVP